MLEGGEGLEGVEQGVARRSGGVDALVEDHEVHPGGLPVAGELDEVSRGSREAVEYSHDELVAGSGG